ncbi:hypothetical protein SUGI_0116440 [Cryptomeria japonica]|nr:hypothetical protein SUGI_0116440 [Cryptomeria japonica]
MALYRRFVVVTTLLLVTVSLLQPTFSHGCDKSARKRDRLSMEYLKVQHHEGIVEGAIVNSTRDQTSSKISNQLTHLQIQGKTAGQENGQNRSLRQRKLKPKFQCKRQIPGGPDPQHH